MLNIKVHSDNVLNVKNVSEVIFDVALFSLFARQYLIEN